MIKLPRATGANISQTELAPSAAPLVGAERDELTALVLRLKRADERNRTPVSASAKIAPTPTALQLANEWQLPREVHEYFIIEAA